MTDERAKFVTGEMRMHGMTMHRLQREARERVVGTKVKILSGKYAGREAIIDGVTFDVHRAKWLFCCMVLRADGSGEILNTDGESRMYRGWDDFSEIVA